jgi:hypothetical protein
MRRLKRTIKVVQLPIEKGDKVADRPQAFPKMPRLYLELIENKKKIKQDLINKEYNPSAKDNYPDEDVTPPKKQINDLSENSTPKNNKTKKQQFEERLNKLIEEEDSIGDESVKELDSDSDDDFTENKTKNKGDSNLGQKLKNKQDLADDSDDDSDRDEPKPFVKLVTEESSKKVDSEQNEDDELSIKENVNVEEDSEKDDLSVRLKELLNDTDDERSISRSILNENVQVEEKVVRKDKYSRQRSIDGKSIDSYKEVREVRAPPTLAELESKGVYQGKKELRDINHIPASDIDDDDAKRELLFKFDLLKKSYNNSNYEIPSYSIHSDLTAMKKSYDNTLRRLSLDTSVEQYKTYLIGGCMASEFALGKFFKLDMAGFTQQQIINMHSYEKLLIEIGEKSYLPSSQQWSVEVRLLFLVLTNAAFFIVSKIIMKKSGTNLLSMINGMNSANAPAQKKPKMKGPSMPDLESLP